MRDHIRIRRFLNRPRHHSVAYIYAVVSDTSTCTAEDCDHRWCGEITLQISDCYRSISLDFDLGDPAARRNSLHKIDVLVDSLTKFRDALRIEAKAASRRRARRSVRADN